MESKSALDLGNIVWILFLQKRLLIQ